MASTPPPPLRYNLQDPPLTPDVTAVTSTTRSQVRRASRFTPYAGATSKSLVCIEGSRDRNQPVTSSPRNDSYLDPLMQWHEKEQQVQSSRNSPDSTAHLHAPLSSMQSSDTQGNTQYRSLPYASASAFPLPPEIVKTDNASYSKPYQRSCAGPSVDYFSLPVKGHAVPSHPPPLPPPTWPAWVVAEQHVQPPCTSPYGPAMSNTWQKPAINDGLNILPAAADYETSSSAPRPLDFHNYVATANNRPLLHTPLSGPYPKADSDDASPHCVQTSSISSGTLPILTRLRMNEDGSPGQGRRDERTIRKQEAFRRKAENAKERRSSVVNKKPKIIPMSGARKRKSRTEEPSFAVQQTAAPAYRNALVDSLPDPYFYGSNSVEHLEQHAFCDTAHGPYTQAPIYQCYPNPPGSWESSQLPSQNYTPRKDYTYRPPNHPPPPHTPAPDPDNLDQLITADYSSYRWSVKLYTIDQAKTGHQYAESWIEALLEALGEGIRRHTHVTQGFIEGGNQFTFLILHNAADPFRYGSRPASTVSIGCYGFHSHDHADIHWTTLATNLRYSINQFVLDGQISEVKKWHPLMEKAKERRFHRAYWLAATMSPLKAILNRRIDDTVVRIVEAVDFCDDGFEFTELNLNNEGCELSTLLAERRWKECEEIAEAMVPGYVHEHIVTGSSEY